MTVRLSPEQIAALLRAHYKLCAACAVLGAVAGLAYGLLAPKWYESTLVVVPSQRSASPAASLNSALPALASITMPFATDIDRIEAVLNTNAVSDAVIEHFGLMRAYDLKHIEEARLRLRRHCSVSTARKANLVTLTCEDQDPKRAQALASYFGEVGNQVFGRVSGSSAAEEKRFLERRLTEARLDLEAASRRLREFQEKHRIVDVEVQAKSVISAMASVRAELIEKELQLSYVSGFSSATEGNVVQLRRQVDALRAKLAELEASEAPKPAKPDFVPSATNAVGGFFPQAMSVPELRFQLEPLVRDQKVQETVVLLLTQRFESAKVDAARDTSTFQVLDPPTVASRPAFPRPLRTTALGLSLGALLSSALAARRILRQRKNAPAFPRHS